MTSELNEKIGVSDLGDVDLDSDPEPTIENKNQIWIRIRSGTEFAILAGYLI